MNRDPDTDTLAFIEVLAGEYAAGTSERRPWTSGAHEPLCAWIEVSVDPGVSVAF